MKAAVLALLLATSASAAETTICDIMQSLDAYDGKMVRVRATVVSGFEVFALRDPSGSDCGRPWLTFAGGGPDASISLSAATPEPRPAIELKKDAAFEEFQRLLSAHMYPRNRDMACFGCNRYEVTATFTGRIDAAGRGHGFGHMNGYRAQFVVESVSEVAGRDRASEYDAKKFSATPVRFPTAILSGRVIAPDGKPVAGARVDAVSTKDIPPFTEWADDDGRFTIEVPPGTYLVSINTYDPPSAAVPFPATYARGAKPLDVADRQHLDNLDIRPRHKLAERHIALRVLWPDGKPVDDANVWLTEVRNPYPVVGGSVSHTKPEGTFDLVGFEGIDYVVHANIYVKPYYTRHCAPSRTIRAGDKIDGPLTMVLTDERCSANE